MVKTPLRDLKNVSAVKKSEKSAKARFAPPIGSEEVAAASKSFVPKNTARQTQWSVKVFCEWATNRNLQVSDDAEKVPHNFLSRAECATSAELLNKWLIRFVLEGTRKQDSSFYPAETVYVLLCGLYRHLVSLFGAANVPNFMAKKNPLFEELNAATDKHYRMLRQEGVGTTKSQAEPITIAEEDLLWSSGVLGSYSPKSLLNAVFFLNGKNFALRDTEQYHLRISQLRRVEDPDGYIYVENGSKNRSGGLQDFKVANKSVSTYALGGERCHVYLLDLYLSKLPVEAFIEDVFYMRPLAIIPARADMPWFLKNRLGQNSCSKMTSAMCEEAGISGRKTNHSLRRTAATMLFEQGVPEKIIQGITGHRSTTGLRSFCLVGQKFDFL